MAPNNIINFINIQKLFKKPNGYILFKSILNDTYKRTKRIYTIIRFTIKTVLKNNFRPIQVKRTTIFIIYIVFTNIIWKVINTQYYKQRSATMPYKTYIVFIDVLKLYRKVKQIDISAAIFIIEKKFVHYFAKFMFLQINKSKQNMLK